MKEQITADQAGAIATGGAAIGWTGLLFGGLKVLLIVSSLALTLVSLYLAWPKFVKEWKRRRGKKK